jgi:hypothetical protein
MIKFFRKIRQQLLTENKFSKYLLYAIGEIVLVVIGILIALSINNQNELRKRDLLETFVLKELKKNLNDDIYDMDLNIDLHKKAIVSSKIITHVIKNQLPFHDSLASHFARIPIVPNFLETRSAYENIKNAGTSLIRNDSLRDKIISLYERDYVFLKRFVEKENTNFLQDLHGLYRTEFSHLEIFGKSYPVNFEKLVKNQEYINYVNHQVTFCEFTLVWYYDSKDAAEKLIKMVKLELDE